MQLARIKGDPEKKRCWYSISQLQCSCSRHPLFYSTPLILLLAPPAARLKAEWKGFPRGSRAKTLEQDKIGRGWIPSCYICPASHPYLCPLSLPSTLNRAPNLLPTLAVLAANWARSEVNIFGAAPVTKGGGLRILVDATPPPSAMHFGGQRSQNCNVRQNTALSVTASLGPGLPSKDNPVDINSEEDHFGARGQC